MGMMSIITSHFAQNYDNASHKTPMLIKAKVLRKAIKGKVMPTRGRPLINHRVGTTPWSLGLQGLVTNMVAQVKSTTYGSRKAKNWKNGQSYGSNVNP